MYRGLMHACGLGAGLLIGAMVVLVCADVGARNLGLGNLPWVVELTEFALPTATFLAAPWLLYRGEHVRLDFLSGRFGKTGDRVLRWFIAAIGLSIALTSLFYIGKVILDARAIGSMVIKSVMFPEWWLFLPMAASFFLLAVEWVRQILFAEISDAARHSG